MADAQDGVGTAAAAQVDAEEVVQHLREFAVRQAGLLVESDHGRLDIGSELTGGSPEGIGSLQRMPALHTTVAAPAATDVEIELALNRLAWNLDLELLLNVGFVDGTAAIGTGIGQRGFVDFVNLLGRRRTMGLLAIIVAGLAAGLFRLGLGRAFGERRRLTLVGPLEFGNAGFEFGNALTQGLTGGADDRLHTFSVTGHADLSCASSPLGALNNYIYVRLFGNVPSGFAALPLLSIRDKATHSIR
ncbi:MAG TPA: hypothetical protein VKS79_01370 [Gemmataceae bacterium]|nr:hypothetical protein [Gemmataceae bacterium]